MNSEENTQLEYNEALPPSHDLQYTRPHSAYKHSQALK